MAREPSIALRLRRLGTAAAAAALTLALAPLPVQAVTFSPKSVAVGASPSSVAVGDFNGDARLDLATANDYFNSVSIVRGNGSGGFGAPTTVGVTGTPYSIAVGKFNGDPHLDLATANLDSNNVSILLGNGSGGFSAPTNFAAGTGPISVAVGNFDGDPHLDLATANYRSFEGDVSILLGNGSGSFSAPTTFPANASPYSIAVGKLNGDAHLDLAVANIGATNDVSILLGDGSGGFEGPTNFSAGDGPSSVAVGDLDADAQADLAVANSSPKSGVSILLGNGTGDFYWREYFVAGWLPRSIAIADFSGDSRPDLAVANYQTNDVSILAGDGTGKFVRPANFQVNVGPASVAVGEFNGDARLDLAVANIDSVNSGDVTVLLNTTSNAYPRPRAASPTRVALVPAYRQCTNPNRVHGPPDLPGNGSNPDGSCNPPVQSSSHLTAGTGDANGAAANSAGFVRLRTVAGAPGGADGSDVEISVRLTDVRCQAGVSSCGPANAAGGADYTGELQARIDLRVTDKYNDVPAGGGSEAATGSWSFQLTVPCGSAPTPNTIGSTCALTTTADAVYGDPRAVSEGRRAIWELGRVALHDGGADGDVETPAGNGLFAVQGLFVP